MTNTLFTLANNDPHNPKNYFLPLLILAVMFFMSHQSSHSQNGSNLIKRNTQIQNVTLFPQPSIKMNPFTEEKKIQSFNPTKNFSRFHYSDLDLEVSVYPNPATDFVSLLIPLEGLLSISNYTGQLIENYEVKEGELVINVSHLPEGAYVLQLFSMKESYTKRLIIHH